MLLTCGDKKIWVEDGAPYEMFSSLDGMRLELCSHTQTERGYDYLLRAVTTPFDGFVYVIFSDHQEDSGTNFFRYGRLPAKIVEYDGATSLDASKEEWIRALVRAELEAMKIDAGIEPFDRNLEESEAAVRQWREEAKSWRDSALLYREIIAADPDSWGRRHERKPPSTRRPMESVPTTPQWVEEVARWRTAAERWEKIYKDLAKSQPQDEMDYAADWAGEVRLDPEDGNAYVLRGVERFVDGLYVRVNDIHGGHERVMFASQWSTWRKNP